MNDGPDDGIAADPHAGRLAEPLRGELVHDLVGQRAATGDDADPARLADVAGNDPHFARPGEMSPGQFGPISRAPRSRRNGSTRVMSSTGMPFRNADDESQSGVCRLEDGGGGRHRRHVDDRRIGAGRSRTASATVSYTGTVSSNCCAPFPGVTPPTTVVPYAIICRVWNEPSRPVMPWTSRRVRPSMKMLTPSPAGDRAFHRVVHVGEAENPASSGCTIASASLVPVSRITSGTLSGNWLRRLDDTVGHVVAARDPAEDVEQNRFHTGIRRDDLQCG